MRPWTRTDTVKAALFWAAGVVVALAMAVVFAVLAGGTRRSGDTPPGCDGVPACPPTTATGRR
jgi:hypothetical protein